MYNKKILSMLLSTVMTVSLTGVPTANAENSSAPTKANALSDEAAPQETTASEKAEYPVITHRELFNGLVSPPSKVIYSKDEFNYDNLDLSGMTISVNDVTETRTNAYSGYSTTTPVEYKIGKVYSDMYRYEAGWYIASLTYDDETGKYSDVNYPGIPNKYTVRFTDAGDVLRFSEPDTPDVIHEVENAYELKFDIYIDDPDDKNEFIRIDNKEVTGYAFGRTLKIKDIGDFTTDMDTYAYVNYYIDQNIHAGDIVSGVLCVDPERKYVICGDLEVVKPAPGNGDANCDNSVDMSDVVLIMQFLANPDKYGIEGTDPNHITNSGLRNADQNGDGVTVEDALILQKKLLGLE